MVPWHHSNRLQKQGKMFCYVALLFGDIDFPQEIPGVRRGGGNGKKKGFPPHAQCAVRMTNVVWLSTSRSGGFSRSRRIGWRLQSLLNSASACTSFGARYIGAPDCLTFPQGLAWMPRSLCAGGSSPPDSLPPSGVLPRQRIANSRWNDSITPRWLCLTDNPLRDLLPRRERSVADSCRTLLLHDRR